MARRHPSTPSPRRRVPAPGALVVLAIAAVTACGTTAPTTASPSPAPSNGGSRGAAVYAERCASCHGADLRGTDKGPSHLSKVYESSHHGDNAFRSAIAKGSRQHHWKFGDMPAIPGMSAADVDAVIAYVREVQQREGLDP